MSQAGSILAEGGGGGGGTTVFKGNSGTANPASGVINIVGGSEGLTSVASGDTVTFSTTGLTTWSVISADQSAISGQGYFCNKSSTLSLALPATSALGDVIEIVNINSGVTVTQGAGQVINIFGSSTTPGTAGSITCTSAGDTVKLVCSNANTTWWEVAAEGIWTIV
jgi:hypothetical protein